MNRAEKFALTAALVGIVADVISILASGVALSSVSLSVQGTGQGIEGTTIAYTINGLVLFSLVYSWIIISWLLLRRYFQVWLDEHSNYDLPDDIDKSLDRFHIRTWGAIIAIGLLLWPLAIIVMSQWKASDAGVGIILWFMGVPLIFLVHSSLMPIVYPNDMDMESLFVFPL